MAAATRFELTQPGDLAGLGSLWRGLTEDGGAASFFQSWSWIGCLAAERYDDPVLLSAEREGRIVALALCNRRRSGWSGPRLFVSETGAPAWDRVFVEYNGPVVAAGADGLLGACLATLLHAPIGQDPGGRRRAWTRRVVLSGVGAEVLQAARDALGPACHLIQTRLAPWLDLSAHATPDAYLASLGRSTRHQLRRSGRLFASSGALRLVRATTVAGALDFLDRLIDLHQASWRRRGEPGAFAGADLRRFHATLIATALPRDEIDLLCVTAGDTEIGYLYNFRHRGHVYAYQSGFAYGTDPHCKPGLTCHHLAIEHYRAQGIRKYDFLAGEDRYKTSLAPHLTPLHWIELARPLTPAGAWLWARRHAPSNKAA